MYSLDIVRYNTNFMVNSIKKFLATNPNGFYNENMINTHITYYDNLSRYFYCLLPASEYDLQSYYIHLYRNELLYYLENSNRLINYNLCSEYDYTCLMRFKLVFIYHLIKKMYNKKTKNNIRKWLFYKQSIDYIIKYL